MIIDSHAHVCAPELFYAYRARLLAAGGFYKSWAGVSDDDLAVATQRNVRAIDAVGTDHQLISPRPFHQMQSAKPDRVVHWWIAANNDIISRTVAAHGDRFSGVAGLPICAGSPVTDAFEELDRAINDLGFVGVILNPDPYEGTGPSPTLGDPYWYPLYERLVDYDVPVLVHSSGCNNGREGYSEHFITEESIAILSLLRSNALVDFPDLKFIIGHGGGSVPYQIGRWQAERLSPNLGGAKDAERFETSLRRLWFDTVLHSPLALELLLKTVGPDRCLFGTERPGSGSAVDPATGRPFDDIKSILDGFDWLSPHERSAVLGGNAEALFPRLAKKLGELPRVDEIVK